LLKNNGLQFASLSMAKAKKELKSSGDVCQKRVVFGTEIERLWNVKT